MWQVRSLWLTGSCFLLVAGARHTAPPSYKSLGLEWLPVFTPRKLQLDGTPSYILLLLVLHSFLHPPETLLNASASVSSSIIPSYFLNASHQTVSSVHFDSFLYPQGLQRADRTLKPNLFE